MSVFVCSLFLTIPIIAETIHGFVVDKKSGRSLLGVGVLIGSTELMTDKNGHFSCHFDEPRKISVTIGTNLLGYAFTTGGGHPDSALDPFDPDISPKEIVSDEIITNDIEIEVTHQKNSLFIIAMDSEQSTSLSIKRKAFIFGEWIDFVFDSYSPNEQKISLGAYNYWGKILFDKCFLNHIEQIPITYRHNAKDCVKSKVYRKQLIDIRDFKTRWTDVLKKPLLIIGENSLLKGTINEEIKANYMAYVTQGGCLFVEPLESRLFYEQYIPGFIEHLKIQLKKNMGLHVLEADGAQLFAKGLGHRELAYIVGGIEILKKDVDVVLRLVEHKMPLLVEYPVGKGKVVISMLGREEVTGPIDFGDPLQNQLLRWYSGCSKFCSKSQKEGGNQMVLHFKNEADSETAYVKHQLFLEGQYDPLSEQEHPIKLMVGQGHELSVSVSYPRDGVYWHRLVLLDDQKKILAYCFPDTIPEK
jgi:hypothetical protein